jgi:hypothetical protein
MSQKIREKNDKLTISKEKDKLYTSGHPKCVTAKLSTRKTENKNSIFF